MEPQQVYENLQRFSKVKTHYKSKKTASGRTIDTGVRVYTSILKKAIPRFYKSAANKYEQNTLEKTNTYNRNEKHDNTNVKNAKYNNDNNNTTESLPGDITEDIRLTLTDKLLTHALQTNTGQRQDWRRDNCRWFYCGTCQEKEEHERLWRRNNYEENCDTQI